MPVDRDDPPGRRSVVPQAAGRSLWLAAAYTGVVTALAAAVIAIAVVAVCWLPAAGASGSAGSALRAGLLTFLAGLHAGITVDGVPAAFLPLGLTLLIGVIAWRAGAGLADAADELDEEDAGRLVRAGVLQVGTFAITCAVLAAIATLGTSSVSPFGALVAAVLLFAITGGVAFVRTSGLGAELAERGPTWLGPAVRAAAAATAVYLAAGALLVAGAVVAHHDRVVALSHQVGGGWSGIPILLLGILAAPNAAIAGASYLGGPGFAIGSGSTVSLGSTLHGTLPAFPLFGALPSGHGASLPVWLLVIATPLVAGVVVARIAYRADTWAHRARHAALGAVGTGLIAAILAWQGGGAIGSGRLHTVGAPPGQVGLALALEVGVATAAVLGLAAALRNRHARPAEDDARPLGSLRAVLAAVKDGISETGDNDEHATEPPADEDPGQDGKLAG